MILTHCPVCAAQLHSTNAKQCSRCKTRYCGAACQEQHWKEGGHDKLCRKIRKCGGAEQFHADTKYTEAVAVAVEKCADDTKGQTCYICTQALHWKTKEGLVRGCSCRGTAGFAHVSCLAEQAKILFEEAEENNLGDKAKNEWRRWHRCSLCEQSYHGVVRCALGWACWKTYVDRPETDWARGMAMSVLGNGLLIAGHHEDALSVQEAELSMKRRLGVPEGSILAAQSNIATTYRRLGQLERALQMQRDAYSGWVKLCGEEHEDTLLAALNYANSRTRLGHYVEAKALLRKIMPVARRTLGDDSRTTLGIRKSYAQALYKDPAATLDDLREAVETLEDTERTARRVLGGNPIVAGLGRSLQASRTVLAAREASARLAALAL